MFEFQQTIIYYLETAGLCLVTMWLIKFLWKIGNFYVHGKKFPGPLALPFIGSAYLLIGKDVMDVVNDLTSKYSLFKIWLGFDLLFVTDCADYTESILKTHKLIEKHPIYNSLKKVLGDGLINNGGHKWRKHRKIISPSFNNKMINSFVDVFIKETKPLINNLNREVGVKNLELYEILSNCTGDTICQTALGMTINFQEFEDRLGTRIDKAMKITAYRTVRPWLYPNFIWNLTETGKELKKVMNVCNASLSRIIKEKFESHRNSKMKEFPKNDTINKTTVNEKKAILDVLITESSLTKRELEDEIRTFIATGTETTAATISNTALALALFPNVQDKIYNEIIEIFGVNGSITPEGVSRMEYTERTIKEALRIFPTTPFIGRAVHKDIQIGDKVFPKGSGIIINVFKLHRNSKYWLDPLKFDPDRFLPEESAKRTPYAYIPFALGPRICIASKYAMVHMKILIAAIVQNFKIHTEYQSLEEIKFIMNIGIRMTNGRKLWLEKR